ncbi:hypothetical protein ABLE91_01625 [Aquabacter sp. CN5-332]|uniref:hypothetical protein n=1 Tax=Aquabacter sp. CN5-332 TaxID=3156608 RepID=UPI0032B5706A
MEHDQSRYSARRLAEIERQKAIAREHEHARLRSGAGDRDGHGQKPVPSSARDRRPQAAGIGDAPSPVGENDLA